MLRSEAAIAAAKERAERIREEEHQLRLEKSRLNGIRSAKIRRAVWEDSFPQPPSALDRLADKIRR
ncbi:MAG: hypothetical protein H0V71_03605 [Chloroflexi bacterium]|nr:hypothetical protein [Chloroflexota bacterium]